MKSARWGSLEVLGQLKKKFGVECRQAVFSPRPTKKTDCIFHPFIFLKFGEVFRLKEGGRNSIEYIYIFHNSRCSVEFANILLKSSEFKVLKPSDYTGRMVIMMMEAANALNPALYKG